MLFFLFFFFKQKTAYEITRRDWSSDVCSSDLTPDDARGDQRARIDIGEAEELVAVGMHLDGGAGFELGQRRGGGVDFVAEDPQVAGAQPAIFAALEFEDG